MKFSQSQTFIAINSVLSKLKKVIFHQKKLLISTATWNKPFPLFYSQIIFGYKEVKGMVRDMNGNGITWGQCCGRNSLITQYLMFVGGGQFTDSANHTDPTWTTRPTLSMTDNKLCILIISCYAGSHNKILYNILWKYHQQKLITTL